MSTNPTHPLPPLALALILALLLPLGMASGCEEADDGESAAGPGASGELEGADGEPAAEGAEAAEPEPEHVPQWACLPHDPCEGPYCEQILIPEGTFPMGSTETPPMDSYWPAGDERPLHSVYLDAYCIDRFEVTLARYEVCVDAGACPPEGLQWQKPDAIDTTVNHYPNECYPNLEACANRAVNGKNYYQAQLYCDWIGARLCTEAEWERAANGPGPDKRDWPWGNDPPNAVLTNIPSVGSGFVEPVDSHPLGASPEGVYNMTGNVYEWVRDAYSPYPADADETILENPVYPPTFAGAEAIGRGSCFFTEPTRGVSERTRFSMTFDWG